MANAAAEAAKREMILKGLRRFRLGETMSRVQLFGDHSSHKDVQKNVLHTLSEMGIIKRVETGHPSMVLFLLQDATRLEQLLRDENQVTALIWPSTGALMPPAVSGLMSEDPKEVVPGTPVQKEVMDLLGKILERQDLILNKVVDPIGENILWVRDQVVEMQKSMSSIKSVVDKMYEILRKLE